LKCAKRGAVIPGDDRTSVSRRLRTVAKTYNFEMVSFAGLPGADLVERGLADLTAGRVSIEALLASVGAPRLQMLGVDVSRPLDHPEHRLYELLSRDAGDAAHSRYNALIRRLVSFERALACARQ
jgi:hypothetical protein